MTENGRKAKVALIVIIVATLIVVLILSAICVSKREPITDEIEQEVTEEETIESAQKTSFRTTADLNQDGFLDLIKVYTESNESGPWESYLQVFLGLEEGNYELNPIYTSEIVGGSHGINGTWALTKKDGKDYLLYSQMYEMQGSAAYTYAVMCVNGNEMITIQTDTVNFLCDPFNYRYWEETAVHREAVIPAFKASLDLWISDAKILVSYDVSTPTFVSTDGDALIEATSYYNLIWERNESERIAEFEQMVGTDEWRRVLYWSSNRAFDLIDFVENLAVSDVSALYNDYNGNKLLRIENCNELGDANIVACGVPASCDIVYYKAGKKEDERVALNKMIEAIVKARMEQTTRPYIITDYEIPEQEMIPVTENMWIVKSIQGYYAYEGSDLGTMEERINAENYVVTEDGLIPFAAQGDDETFLHILIKKDGVYRLQRLQKMF